MIEMMHGLQPSTTDIKFHWDGRPEKPIRKTFSNPILPSGADPWFIQDPATNNYLYSFSTNHGGESVIYIASSPTITGMRSALPTPVWRSTSETYQDAWAPELHFVNGEPLLYVAMRAERENHQMYVLAGDYKNPQRKFELAGKLDTPGWAIDGTLLDGKFFVYSGIEDGSTQNLYITSLADPFSLDKNPICISQPNHPWEQVGPAKVNEGPTEVTIGNHKGIVFSASHSLTDDYTLGLLINPTGDYLNPDAWIKKSEPVFKKTDKVFGPGHISLIKSPDRTEDWLIYHSTQHSGGGWKRQINAQPFYTNEDGTPNFGIPIPPGQEIPLPSGEYDVLMTMSRGILHAAAD